MRIAENVQTNIEFEDIAESGQFEITDDIMAEWAVKKILGAKRERERLISLIEAELAELEIKRKKVETRYESDTSYLLSRLNAYLDRVDRKKTKTQESYQLLSGKLVRKFPKQKLVPDEAALIAWCKENAKECVKQTERVMWSEVKDKFAVHGNSVIYTETGECVACVKVEEVPCVFDVKGD